MTYPDARTAVAALASRSATLADLREIVTSFPELRPVVAAYPDTDDDLLSWLRELHDPLIDAQLLRRSGSSAVSPLPLPEPQSPSSGTASERSVPQASAPPVTDPPSPGQPRMVTPVFTPDPDPPAPSRHRAWPFVVIVAAALLVIGGVGAAFATGLIGASAPQHAVTPTPTPKVTMTTSQHPTTGVSSQPSASEAPTTPAVTSPSPTPPTTPDSAFTCWDGTSAQSLSACGSPEGVAGLRYVFPSLDDNLKSNAYTCKMVDYPKRDAYTFSYDCRLPDETPQSSPQIVRYRFWTDPKAAMKHYKGIFADTGSAQDFVLEGQTVGTVFHSNGPLPEGQGRYAIAFVVLDGHMCLSIEGSSQALLDDMVKEARFRVPDEFLGYSGAQPAEVSWHE